MSEVVSKPAPAWAKYVIGRNPRRTLYRLVVLVGFSIFVFRVLLMPIKVYGPSMSPTYKNGGINFINRMSFLFKEPKRGDIVGIELAGREILLLKRVIALPGEKVGISNGVVYVNGVELSEPYVVLERSPWDRKEVTLEPEEYFVIGDNREMNEKDHIYGEVHKSRIVGKVLF